MLPEPNQPKPLIDVDPNLMIITSHPKTGKTDNLLKLPNSLLIDLERSAKDFGGVYIDVIEEATLKGIHPIRILQMIAADIIKANKELKDYKYDYITIDTTSTLEDLALEYATIMYKSSDLGKDYKGNNLLSELSYGAGYQLLREAFKKLLKPFTNLARYTLILTCHTKIGSVKKDGIELEVKDINLTGKIKFLVSRDARAIANFYRDEDGKSNWLSFENFGGELVAGTSNQRLANKKFLISERGEDGTIQTYWDKIFLNIKKVENEDNKK